MPAINYVWDPFTDNVVKEMDDSGNVIASYNHEPGLHGDLISQERDGATSYYHYDGQGNTLALTDDNGDVTDTYEYNAFGETTASSGTTMNPYRFIGQKGYQYDEETDDYYVRERLYEPAIARWKSPDPLLFEEGVNRFAYVLSNPVNRVDPSGELSQKEINWTKKSCGGYEWDTKWVLGDNEQDGYIVQKVNVRQKAHRCSDRTSIRLTSCNAKIAGKGVYSFTYFEFWRVKGGIVYYDPDTNPPQKKTGAWDDRFSNNSMPNIFGCHYKWGEAIFIPEKAIKKWPPSLKKGGVPNAGELFSVCTNPKVAGVWRAWKRKAKTKSTEKLVERDWNCCECEENKNEEDHIIQKEKKSIRKSNLLNTDCGNL